MRQENESIPLVMTRDDVKAGRRFYHKDDHYSSEFSIRKQFGRQLILKRFSDPIGLITSIDDDSFTISYWLFNQELSVKIPYSELLIIEPKSK